MDNRARPGISIVLPCRNEARHIGPCLRGILAQEEPPDGRGFEVILADGLSDDGTADQIREFAARDPRVRLIANPGRIVSSGLNAGIAAARGDIVIRMDAHTEYASDYVRRCIEVLEETGADNVGGPWVARGEGTVSRAIAAAFASPFAVGGARGHDADHEGPVDTVYLGCWRREAFDRFGRFDEELVRNQDDEFNLRISLAGGSLWQSPRIRSHYTPRPSLAALFRQYRQYGYWKVRVIQMHRRPASVRHLVPVLFVLGVALGWLPGLASRPLGLAYVATLAVYGLLNLAASIRTAAGAGWDLLPLLPAVFLTYHVSYGLGFAWGLLDFVILRRGPRGAMVALTRPPERRVVAPRPPAADGLGQRPSPVLALHSRAVPVDPILNPCEE